MVLKKFLYDWRDLTPAGRVLILNGFTFNLGFYMLLPYLANHLENTIGLSGWYVGLIIGLRVLSQQGMFLVGGTLGDYLGYKRLILLGCLVRVFGFALLGVGQDIVVLVIGAILSGLAGALFTPSSQAYLAYEYPTQEHRDRVFALQSFSTVTGMLLGPIIGLLLVAYSFAWIGLISAGLFFILFWVQKHFLPDIPEQSGNHKQSGSFFQHWLSMLNQPIFMTFVLAASVYQVLFHQLYIVIPHEVTSRHFDVSVITWTFMTTSIMGVVLQLPVSHWISKNLDTGKAMGMGLAIMGSAFLCLSLPIADHSAIPFVVCAMVFSLGSMMVFPLIGSYLPNFAGENELGRYYGLYSCVGGIFAFIGNVTTGWLLSSSSIDHIWIWTGMMFMGGVAGITLYWVVSTEFKTATV
ncbi:MFS transporter [Marinomonas balearica]|uniref:Sugar phosphate permease n=1 Tax=Marinomonas balearica TaxID=491947 RepID=A0A4R6MD51_9GAMM|nr:MFS transporter [Marinomonas balearica]TDO99444.1 sugar phosphate permease [Marinomonas balearica]